MRRWFRGPTLTPCPFVLSQQLERLPGVKHTFITHTTSTPCTLWCPCPLVGTSAPPVPLHLGRHGGAALWMRTDFRTKADNGNLLPTPLPGLQATRGFRLGTGGQDIKDPYGINLRSAPQPWCGTRAAGPQWWSRQSPLAGSLERSLALTAAQRKAERGSQSGDRQAQELFPTDRTRGAQYRLLHGPSSKAAGTTPCAAVMSSPHATLAVVHRLLSIQQRFFVPPCARRPTSRVGDSPM